MKTKSLALASLCAIAMLSACSGEKGEGTSISITGNDQDGKPAEASMDGKTGQVTLDLPGFKADVTLPKIKLSGEDLDIDGVKLYPGSTVTSLNIADGEGSAHGNDSVRIAFDAPADPATVQAWFAERMRAEKFAVTEAPNKLSGTTREGEAFALTLAPGASGHSAVTLAVGGK